MLIRSSLAFSILIFCAAQPAHAAALDGSVLSWPWALPFAGLLLTIATGPLLFPKIWHAHYGKIAAGWALLTLAPLAAGFGVATAFEVFVHAMLAEYLSFIVLLFALYTVAGGILVSGQIRATPVNNTIMLALGTASASIVGTTGAAMILIRPLLRAIEQRQNRVHVVVFFIILVGNVGGALTPLGDPPLFVGFLRGVDFFWTAQNLWLQTTIVATVVLTLFFVLDEFLWRKEKDAADQFQAPSQIRLRGKINFLLIAGIVGSILLPAFWRPGITFNVFGTEVALQNLLRDLELIAIALLSLWLTPNEHRESNGFTWEPIREVAILFAGIFTAIVPVLAMLQAGRDGQFAFLLSAVTANDGLPHEAAYFWLTGILSAFLDNAPTYLVFFELAGGDPAELMGPLGGTLAAISMGAVYMGALTYIGNAPNFMIYTIAEERGIKMPSFFAYFFWASLILVPLFLLLTFLPISPVLKFL
ncbi:MAG: sodium:proton antiporter [Pseudorhodoplanes sp.]|jgi:Na+/H+ antiporter NhaD/arsenite permease-like protein|nr:sodium:proton antiporter [Pseudorhodoplanes sp.]